MTVITNGTRQVGHAMRNVIRRLNGLIAMLLLAGATLLRFLSRRPRSTVLGARPEPITHDQVKSDEEAEWENEGGAS